MQSSHTSSIHIHPYPWATVEADRPASDQQILHSWRGSGPRRFTFAQREFRAPEQLPNRRDRVSDDRHSPQHLLVLRPGLSAFCEHGLAGFLTETIVCDRDELPQSPRQSGFCIPGVNEGAALAFADQHSCTLEAIQLPLDGIERNLKITGYRPAISFSMMEEMQKHRLCRPSTKEIFQSRSAHDLTFGSNDGEFKSIFTP